MDQAIAAAERHVAAFNSHDLAAHAANETPDIAWTQPGVSIAGREAVGGLQQALWNALPDARIELVARVASGGLVMSEEVLTGTHSGPLVSVSGTLAATGRSIRLRFVAVQEVRDGKISAERLYFDQLDLLAQLGVELPGGGD